jgi:hypothetical protein
VCGKWWEARAVGRRLSFRGCGSVTGWEKIVRHPVSESSSIGKIDCVKIVTKGMLLCCFYTVGLRAWHRHYTSSGGGRGVRIRSSGRSSTRVSSSYTHTPSSTNSFGVVVIGDWANRLYDRYTITAQTHIHIQNINNTQSYTHTRNWNKIYYKPIIFL